MINVLSERQVKAWLTAHGLDDEKIEKVLKGIDTSRPMYLRVFEPGEKLVQYRDRPSVSYPFGALGGQWFTLDSLHPDDLGKVGIGHGPTGRSRHELTVMRFVEALETTARPMPEHPAFRYRGPGGATQIFLPDEGLSSLM